MTNLDLHLEMLMAGLGFFVAQTSVMRIAACWKGVDLVRAVWGGIMDGQKTDLVVMQGNLNARRYIDFLHSLVIPFLHNQGSGVYFPT